MAMLKRTESGKSMWKETRECEIGNAPDHTNGKLTTAPNS